MIIIKAKRRRDNVTAEQWKALRMFVKGLHLARVASTCTGSVIGRTASFPRWRRRCFLRGEGHAHHSDEASQAYSWICFEALIPCYTHHGSLLTEIHSFFLKDVWRAVGVAGTEILCGGWGWCPLWCKMPVLLGRTRWRIIFSVDFLFSSSAIWWRRSPATSTKYLFWKEWMQYTWCCIDFILGSYKIYQLSTRVNSDLRHCAIFTATWSMISIIKPGAINSCSIRYFNIISGPWKWWEGAVQ